MTVLPNRLGAATPTESLPSPSCATRAMVSVGRGYGRLPYLVIRGARWRLKLRVYDLTGEDIPAGVREERPTYVVTSLPATASPSTSFASGQGRQRYHGEDPQEALRVIEALLGMQVAPAEILPRALLKYFIGHRPRPRKPH